MASQAKIKPNNLTDRIVYFLNAIYYCMWLGNIARHKIIKKFSVVVMDFIFKYCGTSSAKEKYFRNKALTLEEIDSLFYDKRTGYSIGFTYVGFNVMVICYSFLITAPISIPILWIKQHNPLSLIIFVVLSTSLPEFIRHITILKDNRYLTYFKRFEREDEHWRKKWKRITILFVIGAFLSALIGLILGFVIAIYIYNHF